ncbi:MAG: hypothetical protein RRY29_03870 [Desulfovibrionaceae bacterium]
MIEIPLIAVPSQSLQILLDGQECTISVYQRNARLYMDMDVGDVRVVTGAICLDGVNVVWHAQVVFTGSLHFVDTQGREAPQWAGLGSRWRMIFINAGTELSTRLQF